MDDTPYSVVSFWFVSIIAKKQVMLLDGELMIYMLSSYTSLFLFLPWGDSTLFIAWRAEELNVERSDIVFFEKYEDNIQRKIMLWYGFSPICGINVIFSFVPNGVANLVLTQTYQGWNQKFKFWRHIHSV
jgi:hypothetical protein